jgi:hypothetical protein
MRRALALGLVALTLAAGCGAGSTKTTQTLDNDYAAVLRATASKTTGSGSSKLDMVIDTVAGAQHIKVTATGAFAYAGNLGRMDLTLGGIPGRAATVLQMRITGGNLYMQLPGQPGFYRISLSDLVGTSLADSSNPTSTLSTLAGVSNGVTKVGSDTVRGAAVTHYKGTIDLNKALAQLTGPVKKTVETLLAKSKVATVPFDAYLDGQGRMRKLVEHVQITVQGKQADVTTTIELYDFGTKVSVVAPPADQIKDGSALLAAFKNGAR